MADVQGQELPGPHVPQKGHCQSPKQQGQAVPDHGGQGPGAALVQGGRHQLLTFGPGPVSAEDQIVQLRVWKEDAVHKCSLDKGSYISRF